MTKNHNSDKYSIISSAVGLGCSCKVSSENLQDMLCEAELKELVFSRRIINLTDDSCLLQTLDFFTPIIEDPLIQGKITACNVLNDLYCRGITQLAGASVMIALTRETPIKIASEMVKGFNEKCKEAGTEVVGGHTIYNSSNLIGGCITGIVNAKKIIHANGAKPGDVLLMTKPLGAQVALEAFYFIANDEKGVFPELDVVVDRAIKQLTTISRDVAFAMQKVGVNAATDITGYGLLGHAKEIAASSKVNIEIDTLPVIKGLQKYAELICRDLKQGDTSETAGGILISVSREKCGQLCRELNDYGTTTYLIGQVTEGNGDVKISKNPTIMEI
jgi:selenide, water dikinase